MIKKGVVCLLCLLMAVGEAFACTNVIVGRKASADGSVMCTYNCDTFGYSGWLTRSPAGYHAPGEKIAIRNFWHPGEIRGYVDQVEYTYNVIGYMNEHQVTILETTFGGREELKNPEGMLGYDNVMQLALQRCRTAREAIVEMGRLMDEYGYCDEGETFSVCDPYEAWIMELIGKGPGRKGAVWVARRVPDNAICAHANQSRIRRFPLKDPENCLYSKDVISFAREMGYFSGKDADFSFREAYCPFDFQHMRLCEPRVWSVYRHHTDPAYMDSFMPYLDGHFDVCDELPLWIQPSEPVTLKALMADMRDHFEGTPLDMTKDVMAGPWSSPIRPRAKSFTSEGKQYFRERPISTQQAGFAVVAQMRSWLPDAVGGVYYFNCDDPGMVAYVPVYCGVTEIPEAFREEHNRNGLFDEGGAYWLCNWVSNMVYPRYSALMPELLKAREELERFYAGEQAAVVEEASALTPAEREAFLNERTAAYTQRMMGRWSRLARELIVKFNDQPGTYDQPFWDAVARDTGERYLIH